MNQQYFEKYGPWAVCPVGRQSIGSLTPVSGAGGRSHDLDVDNNLYQRYSC